MSQKEQIGPGSIGHLGDMLRGLHATKVLIITHTALRDRIAALKEIASCADGCSISWQAIDGPCARIKDVEDGIALCSSASPDAVVAIGPGHVIDAAKVINLCFSAGVRAIDFIRGDAGAGAGVSPVPLVAVPTEPDSGSEATCFADIFIERDAIAVSHPLLRPTASIVDARLMMTLAPDRIGPGALHALVQAVESYWSINATGASRDLAAGAIRLIMANAAGRGEPAVAALAEGAHRSGRAADSAGRNACHAIAFSLMSVLAVGHDQAAGMVLPWLYLYNSDFSLKDTMDPRGEGEARETMHALNRLFGRASARGAVARIRSLMKSAGVKPTLSSLGILVEDSEAIIRSINYTIIKSNPRPLNDGALRYVLREIEGLTLSKRIKKALLPAYLLVLEAFLWVRSVPLTVSMLADRIAGKKTVVLELGEITLIQYLHPIVMALAATTKSISVYIATKDIFLDSEEFDIFGGIGKKRFPLDFARKLFLTDLFLSAYINSIGPKRAIRLHVFHNLPVKHESYRYQDFIKFNSHFILGDLTLKMLETTIRQTRIESHSVRIFKVGYPKSDSLIRGDYRRQEVLAGLGLDPSLPTVLYAPSWDDGMSLRTGGERIIELILGTGVNLIVKLHPLSYSPPEHPFYHSFTGGIDWRERLKRFDDRKNFAHVISIRNINPLLAASDVMVTDLSSVALEFILLDRPVIIIECPDFFERVLPKNYIGWGNIDSDYIKSNPLTNGGRHVGHVVEDIETLPDHVRRCIENPGELSEKRKEFAATLLYHQGHASQVAADTIVELLFGRRDSKIGNEL